MTQNPQTINEHIAASCGIKDLERVLGFYHLGYEPIVEILEVSIKGEKQTRYYTRMGEDKNFRKCNPQPVLKGSLQFFSAAMEYIYRKSGYNTQELLDMLGLELVESKGVHADSSENLDKKGIEVNISEPNLIFKDGVLTKRDPSAPPFYL